MLSLKKTFKQINREPLFKIEDVRSIFDKLDSTTEVSVTKEFLDLKVYLSQEALKVVFLIFENINDRPTLKEHYARICFKQVEDELINSKGKSKFKRHLNYCAGQLSDPTCYMNLTCNRALFVGHLYLQDLVDFTVMITLIEYLTKSAALIPADRKRYHADDDSLQSAVRLLELVGRALHAETQSAYDEWAAATAAAAAKAAALPAGKTARLPSPARKNSAPAPFSVDTVLCALETTSTFVNSATRTMIIQLREVNNNGWIPKDLIDWSSDGPSQLGVTVSNKDEIKPPKYNVVENFQNAEKLGDESPNDAKLWKHHFEESQKKLQEMEKKYRQLLMMTGKGKHIGK